MSDETYWLEKRDADFILHVLAKYGSGSKTGMKQQERIRPGDPVYEITVSAHEWNAVEERSSQVEYPSLQEALRAEDDER